MLPKNQSVGGERGEAGHRLAQRTARPYRCRPGSLIGSPLASAAKRETSKEVKEAGGAAEKQLGGTRQTGGAAPLLRSGRTVPAELGFGAHGCPWRRAAGTWQGR